MAIPGSESRPATRPFAGIATVAADRLGNGRSSVLSGPRQGRSIQPGAGSRNREIVDVADYGTAHQMPGVRIILDLAMTLGDTGRRERSPATRRTDSE